MAMELNYKTLTLANATKKFSGVGANVDNPQMLALWEVPSNTKYSLLDGEAIRMELYDTEGAEIDNSSLVIFAGLTVNQKIPGEITQLAYEPFGVLTLAQQASDEYKDRLRISVSGGGRTLMPKMRLVLAVESSTAGIDPAQSVVSFRVRQDPA